MRRGTICLTKWAILVCMKSAVFSENRRSNFVDDIATAKRRDGKGGRVALRKDHHVCNFNANFTCISPAPHERNIVFMLNILAGQ